MSFDPRYAQVNVHQSNGTTFYHQPGERVEDYTTKQVAPINFHYRQEQKTLICCECDFSFTNAMIDARGHSSGALYSTTLHTHHKDWSVLLPQRLGMKKFSAYKSNYRYIKSKQCFTAFGIDATKLHYLFATNHWFDRILCTFPRIYNTEWTKAFYNKQNKELLLRLLHSYRQNLAINGEIHMLLFKEQFARWKMKHSLDRVGLEMAYWCQFDRRSLKRHFPRYTPRDIWGNHMRLTDGNKNDLVMYYCSFKVNMNPPNPNVNYAISMVQPNPPQNPNHPMAMAMSSRPMGNTAISSNLQLLVQPQVMLVQQPPLVFLPQVFMNMQNGGAQVAGIQRQIEAEAQKALAELRLRKAEYVQAANRIEAAEKEVVRLQKWYSDQKKKSTSQEWFLEYEKSTGAAIAKKKYEELMSEFVKQHVSLQKLMHNVSLPQEISIDSELFFPNFGEVALMLSKLHSLEREINQITNLAFAEGDHEREQTQNGESEAKEEEQQGGEGEDATNVDSLTKVMAEIALHIDSDAND